MPLLSNQLNATFGSLWIHLDVQENIRYISYSDFDTKTEWKSFEINVLADQDFTITETEKYARQWADFLTIYGPDIFAYVRKNKKFYNLY